MKISIACLFAILLLSVAAFAEQQGSPQEPVDVTQTVQCSFFNKDCFSCVRGFDRSNHTVLSAEGLKNVRCSYCPATETCSPIGEDATCEDSLALSEEAFAEASEIKLNEEAARTCPCTTALDCEDCTATGECGWCATELTFNNTNGACMLSTANYLAASTPQTRKNMWTYFSQDNGPKECKGMWIQELKCPVSLVGDMIAMVSVMFLGFFMGIVALTLIVGLCCAGLCMVLTVRVTGPKHNTIDQKYLNLK